MANFRKKPVVIEARQFDGNNQDELMDWIGRKPDLVNGVMTFCKRGLLNVTLQISTLEGIMEAVPQDWIIKGVKGEFYPCHPEIFEATYEAV